jgi:cytochrome o ubiquinol oxidase subunit 2
MQFQVHAVPPQQFAAWAQGARGKGPVLDGAAYAELSKPSSYMKPITYGAVAPGLFDAIVANRAPQLHLPQTAPLSRRASAVPPGG